MKSLTFNAESGISDIMTIDTRTGLEEIRILKSDISTLLATTINASSLTTLNGGLEMDNDKFTVEDDTGNTLIGGTLGAGETYIPSKAHLNGGLQMDGNKFVVEDGTGNTNIEGSLTVEQLTTFKGSIDLSSPIGSSSEIIIEDQKNVSLTFKTDTGVDLVTLNTDETFPEVNIAGQLTSRDDHSAGTLRGGQLNMERAGIRRSNPAMVETISHGLNTDDTIIIDGLVGMEDLNGGVYTVDPIDSSNFQLRGVNSELMPHYRKNGQFTSMLNDEQGVIENISFVGSEAVMTLTKVKRFDPGDMIIISDTNTTADGVSFVVTHRDNRIIQLDSFGGIVLASTSSIIGRAYRISENKRNISAVNFTSSLIQITTETKHGLSHGDRVIISLLYAEALVTSTQLDDGDDDIYPRQPHQRQLLQLLQQLVQ